MIYIDLEYGAWPCLKHAIVPGCAQIKVGNIEAVRRGQRAGRRR